MIDLGIYKVIEKDEFKNIVFINISYNHIIYLSYDDNYDKFQLYSKWNVYYHSQNNIYQIKEYNKSSDITYLYRPIKTHLEQVLL